MGILRPAIAPVLFDNDDFGGRQFRVDQDVSDLNRRGFGDKASSICVPRGWVVELFSDDSFRGDRLELVGPYSIADLKRDRPDGENWGDRISSIRCSRRRR